MSDYIGNVSFENDCVIASDLPPGLRGQSKATLGGCRTYVVTGASSTWSYDGWKLTFKFEWEPYSNVKKLYQLWAKNTTVNFSIDNRYGSCIMDADSGLKNVRHASGQDTPVNRVENGFLDIWNGEVTVIVLAGDWASS